MKRKSFLIVFLMALLVIPFSGFAQRSSGLGGKSLGLDQGGEVVSSSLGQGNGELPMPLILEILTKAAPQFGFSPTDFIREYFSCNCITIQVIGPNTYLVTYGGIGIQIIIDGSRYGTIDPPKTRK